MAEQSGNLVGFNNIATSEATLPVGNAEIPIKAEEISEALNLADAPELAGIDAAAAEAVLARRYKAIAQIIAAQQMVTDANADKVIECTGLSLEQAQLKNKLSVVGKSDEWMKRQRIYGVITKQLEDSERLLYQTLSEFMDEQDEGNQLDDRIHVHKQAMLAMARDAGYHTVQAVNDAYNARMEAAETSEDISEDSFEEISG